MNRIVAGSAVVILVLAVAASARAQEATERFIPIGQSPGLSGKLTTIGSIQAVDAGTRTLTVGPAASPLKARVSDRTSIWVDRSRTKETNTTGTFADLRSGRRVEIRWDAKVKDLATWIKVEAAPL